MSLWSFQFMNFSFRTGQSRSIFIPHSKPTKQKMQKKAIPTASFSDQDKNVFYINININR